MSLPNYTRFFEHARMAITGDPSGEVPSQPILQFLAPTALDLFLDQEPCAANWEDYEQDSPDWRAFNAAVGAKIAELYWDTPGAVDYLASTKSLTMGPLKETTEGETLEGRKAVCSAKVEEFRKLLSCVRARAEAAPHISLFGLAGRSRSRCCGSRRY